MGVRIDDIDSIINADVSTIHYGKNLVFTDYDVPHTYLKEVSKINVSRLRDTNQTNYLNEGHAVKYRSNSFEVVMYDKLVDLHKARISEKRSIEKDNYCQLSFLGNSVTHKPFEVLRIEVRLGSRKKIRQVFNKLGIDATELNFSMLFSNEISRTIHLATIDEIENAYPMILKTNEEDLIQLGKAIKVNNPKIRFQQLAEILLAKQMIEKEGVREFRKFLDMFGYSKWHRLNKRIQEIYSLDTVDVFSKLRNQIVEFKQIKFEDYQQ